MRIKLEQSLREKSARAHAIIDEMISKDLIAADDADIQAEIASGKPLFDARASAFKIAIDKQAADLLAMDGHTLKAFATTVQRVKAKSNQSNTPSSSLKKAARLRFNEFSAEDNFLNDIFGQMGSQKGRTE